MKTFKDFLEWYNNLDVIPFVEAIEKMKVFYKNKKLDLFKDGVSLPGLVLKYLINLFFGLCFGVFIYYFFIIVIFFYKVFIYLFVEFKLII